MNDQLTKEDLLNMMDSYKSNIEFNKQLFGSQEKILSDHNRVIENIGTITKSQEKLMIQFEHLVDKLTVHNTSCLASLNSSISSVKEVGEKIAEHNLESIRHNGKIENHLIAVYSILSGIVATLLITLIKFWNKVGVS